MNQEKIGKYIKGKRKEKNITQEELSEILGVSNKAVSNWENGKNMPDLSLFKKLCETLDITINELLSGEDIEEKKYINKLEENIINVINNDKKRKNSLKKIFMVISISVIITSILIFAIMTIQITPSYEYANITCEKGEKYVRIHSKGLASLYATSKKIDDKYYRIYNLKMNLIDIPSDYRNEKNEKDYVYIDTFESIYDKTYIYYTNINIKKIDEMTDEEFMDNINELNLVCSFEKGITDF